MVTMRPKETLALNPAAPPTRRTHRNVGAPADGLGSPGVTLMTLLLHLLHQSGRPTEPLGLTDKLTVA